MECFTVTLKVQSPIQLSPSKSPHRIIPIYDANQKHSQAFQAPNGLHSPPIKFTHGRKPITMCRAVENITVGGDDNSEESEEEIDNVEDIVDLKIEKTGKNSRKITATIEVEAPLVAIWNVLTDYERLADFIPGLAVSQLLERREKGARLLQIGEQNLAFGLKFKAKGIVDVCENELEILPVGIRRDIDFKMVEGDFQVFEGKWGIEQVANLEKSQRHEEHAQSVKPFCVQSLPERVVLGIASAKVALLCIPVATVCCKWDNCKV